EKAAAQPAAAAAEAEAVAAAPAGPAGESGPAGTGAGATQQAPAAGRHQKFPAEAGWMSLTCQCPAPPTTVSANWLVFSLLPLVLAIFWVIVTMKVRLPGPKARSELILARPVDTCFSSARGPASPGVEYAR